MPNMNSPQMLIAVPYLARSASIFWKIGYRSKQKDNLEKGLWLFVEAAGNVSSVYSRVFRKMVVWSTPIDSKWKFAIFLY